EARVAHWRHVAQPALHLVGQGERGEEVATRRAGVFRGGEHGPEVVARVTGLALREVAVVEVEVALEGRVVEGRSIWCGVAAGGPDAPGAGRGSALRAGVVTWQAGPRAAARCTTQSRGSAAPPRPGGPR